MTDTPSWLLLVHQLPPLPSRLRVRVWRQLQKLGAVTVKNSVYVLPWSERTHEDFTWLQQEIQSGGGEAVVFRANAVAGTTDEEIIASFRRDRDAAYARLLTDLDALGRRMAGRRPDALPSPADLNALETEVNAMQSEFENIEQIDFYQAPGRARTAMALDRCRRLLRSAQGRKTSSRSPAAAKPARQAADYQGKLWVTRPRPHIDRCASAWLIRRFIDRRPRFAFVAEGGKLRGGIPFDMSGAEFGHHEEDCTFETLIKHFGLQHDAAVTAIAQIVHDIDLKDGKFGRPESVGVNAVLRGLLEGVRDDQLLLSKAGEVFDGLHATLATQPGGNRKNAKRRRG